MKRVLIVEDDPTTAKLLQEILSREGYLATVAYNGKDAWLELSEEKMPHLIITDIMLPGMDGYTLIRQLKANPESQLIPVLAISTRRQMEDTILSAGAQKFLSKPFSHEELLIAIHQLLDPTGPLSV